MWLNSRQAGIRFLSEDDYVLAHLVRSPGQRFGYLYDLGDRWQHEILVSAHGTLLTTFDSNVTRWRTSSPQKLAMELYEPLAVQERLSRKMLAGVANGKK